MQRRDHGVQAAVAARDDDLAAAAAVQHAVELARVGGGRDLDVGGRAQHGEGPVEVLLVGAPGLGVGDQQQWVHGRRLSRGADAVPGVPVRRVTIAGDRTGSRLALLTLGRKSPGAVAHPGLSVVPGRIALHPGRAPVPGK